MSQGDLADSARTRSSSGVAGNNTDAATSPVATRAQQGNKNPNITTNVRNNTQHVPYVASGPYVSTTLRTSVMQPRSGYKNDDGSKYFEPYDPWIGIRTAAILGGFLMLIVVYILYKARCRLSGSIEVTKVSYYQEYKDRCRERILTNIRARNNMANSVDRTHHHQGGDGVTSLDLTAKWIQSQPLCSAIPDESSEVKTPNLNRMQNPLHLSDIQLQTSSPDLRSPPGGRERNKALLELLRESNQDHFPINHRNFTAIGEFPICDGKVPNTDVANSSDLTYLSGQSPPLSNTHYHVPLIHNAVHKDSDPSIDENSNLPSTKLNAESVQIEMVPLSSHRDSDTDTRDNNSVKSVKSVASDRTPEQRTTSHETPLTNDSRARSQSHSSLIPSASSMSSGLELIDPLRLITANGGPKLHKKSRSNGNIVTMKLDSQYALWRPPNNTVTKL